MFDTIDHVYYRIREHLVVNGNNNAFFAWAKAADEKFGSVFVKDNNDNTVIYIIDDVEYFEVRHLGGHIAREKFEATYHLVPFCVIKM